MTETNNGPRWARKAQSNAKWGGGVMAVVLGLVALRIVTFLAGTAGHSLVNQDKPGIPYGGFGAPSKTETARFLQTLDATSVADSHDFDREAKAAGADGSLTPAGVFRPGGVARAEATLTHLHDTVAKYEALAKTRKADGRAKLAALYTNPAQRDRALAEFDQETGENEVTLARYWSLQYEVVDREQAVVGDLARGRGAWRPVGGKVMFMSTSLRQAYQRDVDALRETGAQIDSVVLQVNTKNAEARAKRRAAFGE